MDRPADVIVLSPHLDDGVLSLGGMIGREAAKGRRVEVWTCFTAGPYPDQIPAGFDALGDYLARREEDLRALAVLGATPRWLDLRERLWRDPPLRRHYHVFHTPRTRAGFEALPALHTLARELLSGPAEFYAPLGVGHHHDHVEVAVAVISEMLAERKFDHVRFYEDPYAQGGFCRRAHFVTRRRLWKRRASPAWASPRMGMLLWGAALCSKGPQVEDYVPEADRLHWSSIDMPVSLEDEGRKLEAVSKYTSQVKAFGGEHVVSAFLCQNHVALNGEPIWQATAA